MLSRMLPLFLLLAAQAPAQNAFPISINPEFQRDLALANPQVEELQRNAAQYRDAQRSTFERINVLNDEIRVETQKPAPDTAALGARYAEIETVCRQSEPPLRELQQRQLSVLNDEQRARLTTLQQAQSLQAASIAAEGLMLIPPRTFIPSGLPTVFNGTPTRAIYTASPFFITLGGPDVTPDLVAYLSLTETQLIGLRQAIRDYQEFFTVRFARINEVSRETQAELAGAAPNAAGVGARYGEIEAQRTRLAALIQPGLIGLSLAEALSLRLILPQAAARPASRPSSVTVQFGFGSGSFGSISGSFSAAQSIYRTCLAGPEYEYRVPAFTPGPLGQPTEAVPAPGSSRRRTE